VPTACSDIYANKGKAGKPDLNELIDRKKILEYVFQYSARKAIASLFDLRGERPASMVPRPRERTCCGAVGDPNSELQ
jgi:hypothetical protein